MQRMEFTSGEAKQDTAGRWYYVVEWLSQRRVWVAYGIAERYGELRHDIDQLERLGYYHDRRRVRHWHKVD